MFLISDLVQRGYIANFEETKMPSSSAANASKCDSDVSVTDDNLDTSYEESKEDLKALKKRKDNRLKHKCPFDGCTRSFPRPWRLKNHLQVHNGIKIFKCDEGNCDKAYTSKSHLQRHVAQCHSTDTEPKTFACSAIGCEKVLKTRDILIKHMRRFHSEQPFQCHICFMTFRSSELLEKHSKLRHKNQSCHKCEHCDISFHRLRSFNRHMRKHRLHVCHIASCIFVSDNFASLIQHVRSQHPESTQNTRLLQCDLCGKEVKDKSLIRKHIQAHLVQEGLIQPKKFKNPNNKFNCSHCQHNFSTKASLQRHIRLITETQPRIRKPVKTLPERALRKDKNVPKQCAAAQLTSVRVPLELQKAILDKKTPSSEDQTSKIAYSLMLKDLQQRIEIPQKNDTS